MSSLWHSTVMLLHPGPSASHLQRGHQGPLSVALWGSPPLMEARQTSDCTAADHSNLTWPAPVQLVTRMQMLNKGRGVISWRLRGRLGGVPIDIDFQSTFELDLITGRVRHPAAGSDAMSLQAVTSLQLCYAPAALPPRHPPLGPGMAWPGLAKSRRVESCVSQA